MVRYSHPLSKAERNREIYQRYKAGERIVSLAKEYGVSEGRIGQIVEKERRIENETL